MEKKKPQPELIAWISAAVMSRILYLFMMQDKVVDTYAYFANAINRAARKEPVLNSGLAYAYTEKLSDVLAFAGESLSIVAVFHVLLQILWLVIFFFGVRKLWGRLAGFLAGSVLMVSSFVFQTLQVVEPANFLMFHWSVLLLLFGIFYEQTIKRGWFRSNTGELYLMVLGFYMGVVCIWNYLGLLMIGVMIYVLIRNQMSLSPKLWMQKNIQNVDMEEKEQLMPVISQGFILIMGMLVGMFATLMKYTGLTGQPVIDQFFWWTDQFGSLPGRCQDVAPNMLIWLIAAGVVGIGGQALIGCIKKKADERREYEELVKQEQEKKEMLRLKKEKPQAEKEKPQAEKETIEQQDEYFIAEDGRKIKLLHNPLPGPKKHVKKEMEFEIEDLDIEFLDIESDDFDHKIESENDFDLR